MDRSRGFDKKREVFDLLGKYMDEYGMDCTRIFNVNNSSTATVKKYQKTLHRAGKPAALHNAGWVAFTDCANWTECVIWCIAGAAGVSPSISCKVGTEGKVLQLWRTRLRALWSAAVCSDVIWLCSCLQVKEMLRLEHSFIRCWTMDTSECKQI